MKKNAIKFWLKNRFTAIALAWVCVFIILGVINDVYLNAFIFIIGGFATLFYSTYLIENNKLNSSERLMWIKYLNLVDNKD